MEPLGYAALATLNGDVVKRVGNLPGGRWGSEEDTAAIFRTTTTPSGSVDRYCPIFAIKIPDGSLWSVGVYLNDHTLRFRYSSSDKTYNPVYVLQPLNDSKTHVISSTVS